jgi:transcriptional regulator with XRE-family HTH domain
MDLTPLAKEVERRMKALGLTRKSLSRKAKLNETFVRDLFEGKSQNPRLDSIQKLATALECNIVDLLASIFGQFPQIAEDEAKLVQAYRRASERRRALLVELLDEVAPPPPPATGQGEDLSRPLRKSRRSQGSR